VVATKLCDLSSRTLSEDSGEMQPTFTKGAKGGKCASNDVHRLVFGCAWQSQMGCQAEGLEAKVALLSHDATAMAGSLMTKKPLFKTIAVSTYAAITNNKKKYVPPCNHLPRMCIGPGGPAVE
jgi:hypothetical protein